MGLLYCLLFSFFTGNHQSNPEQLFFDDFVECFYPKGDAAPLYIYDAYQGNVLDSLMDGGDYQWYKMAVSESRKDGWFCLKNILQGPASPGRDFPQYEGAWVHSNKLKLFVPDLGRDAAVCFF